MQLTLEISNSDQLSSVYGSFDRHLDLISKSLDVIMNNKGEDFTIKGEVRLWKYPIILMAILNCYLQILKAINALSYIKLCFKAV
jgi:phosphate starvation-inducible protein PhoH